MHTSAITTIPRGASIYRFEVAGQNIVLSFPHPALHDTLEHPFFGETIGRVANRIENATLADLNGQTYQLNANNGANSLHGGSEGWGKAQWQGPTCIRRGSWDADITGVPPADWREPGGTGREGVCYTHLSPHGDEHFPGTVRATVWYFEGRDSAGKVILDSEYEVQFADETPGVHATVVGMTNHSYFNLNPPAPARSPDLAAHTLTLATALHQTPSTEDPGLPDGTFTPHPRVPAAHQPFELYDEAAAAAVPLDECFVLAPPLPSPAAIPLDTRPQPLRRLAELRSRASGLVLCVDSTEPAFQCYTGGFVDVPAWPAGVGPDSVAYPAGAGFAPYAAVCIEPSRFVNAAGRHEWRGMVLLERGATYGARTRYTAWKDHA